MNFLDKIKDIESSKIYEVGGPLKSRLNNNFVSSEPRKIVICWVAEEKIKSIAGITGQLYPPSSGELFEYEESGHGRVTISLPVTQEGKFSPYLPIEEYLKSQLITIDAFAIDLKRDRIVDPLSGFQDLKNNVIRVTDHARLSKNPTDILNIALTASITKFKIIRQTQEAMRRVSNGLKNVTNEDMGTALRLAMSSDNPKIFFDTLDQIDALKYVMPRLYEAKKIKQTRKTGVTNVKEHSLLCVEAADKNNEAVRWAALYHDLGKLSTKKIIDGKVRFFGHEKVSAKWAYKDLLDWGFGREFAKEVAHLALHHMFDGGPQLTDDGVRRLIKRVGKQHIFNLLDLRAADSAGFVGKPTGLWKVKKLRQRVKDEIEKNPFSHAGLNINTSKVKELINNISDSEVTLLMDLLLDMVLFYGLSNNEKDLISWITNINFNKLNDFCPLGVQWLLEQHISKIEGRADENSDGTFKCGKYCLFKCDNQQQTLWKF